MHSHLDHSTSSSEKPRIARASTVLVLVLVALLVPTGPRTTFAEPPFLVPDPWVGNVDGTVRDADMLVPIPNANVFLFESPVQRAGAGDLLRTNQGDVVRPDMADAVLRGTADDAGEFLLNSVPTAFPFKVYTIVVTAPGYAYFIADRARVLPGAVMSLNVEARLSKDTSFLIEPSDRRALNYRHEMEIPGAIPSSQPLAPLADDRVTYTIFAAREGLVGHTTANGHLILPHDRFVALPSARVLNANDRTYDFRVRLTSGNKSVDVPVWDVGPWNTTDDYWNPSSIRERWQDLPQGMPEAQAAQQTGYNGGCDQFWRTVTAPLGIDVADGTFWDDLGLLTSAWVSVKFLWKPNVVIGDRVYASADLPVRPAPGGTPTAVEHSGAAGIIKSGPVGATFNQVFYVWWEIQWGDGVKGWSTEDSISKTPVPLTSVSTASPSDARQPSGTCGIRYYFPFLGR